jgi:hypothetical protein
LLEKEASLERSKRIAELEVSISREREQRDLERRIAEGERKVKNKYIHIKITKNY